MYTTLIRPLLEYACPAWHHGLSIKLHSVIEHVQKRVLRIIFGDNEYNENLKMSKLTTLEKRRNVLSLKLRNEILTNNNNKISHLIPSKRINKYNIRRFGQYQQRHYRTNRFKSCFINYWF